MKNRFFLRAIAPVTKPQRDLGEAACWYLDSDIDAGIILANAAGEVSTGDAKTISATIMAMPRHSVVWCDPGRVADVAVWCEQRGLLRPMVAAGWQIEPAISGNRTLALRLVRSRDHQRAHARIQSLRAWERNGPHIADTWQRVQVNTNRAWSLTVAVYEAFGVRPGITPAATAYDCWRHTMGRDRAHYRPAKQAIADLRAAFFGGIVAGPPADLKQVRQYDMRGAYAWALQQGVPIGPATYTVHEQPREVPGIYQIRARLSGRFPSPFMTRDSQYVEGPGLQSSQGGSVETWATSEDIALAREWGADVEVIRGWVFYDGIGTPFDNFVARVSILERDSGIRRAGAKLLRNSLYGRFGRRATVDRVLFVEQPPDDPHFMPYYGIRGPAENMWIWRGMPSDSPGLMPQWATWIAAAVRRRLLRAWVALIDAGHSVYYVDTDAIITDGVLPTGNDYGDWKLVHHYRAFRVFAAKRYVGVAEGDLVVEAWAGIPRCDEQRREVSEWYATHAYLASDRPP